MILFCRLGLYPFKEQCKDDMRKQELKKWQSRSCKTICEVKKVVIRIYCTGVVAVGDFYGILRDKGD